MRKWTLKVNEFPALKDKYYACKIISLGKSGKNAFHVTFELLSSNQTGRQISISLPLPVRPQGISISFFHSCGFTLKTEDHFDPKEAIGRTLQCLFSHRNTELYEAVSFKPISNKEANYA